MSTVAAAFSSATQLPSAEADVAGSRPRRSELPAWMGVRGFIDIHFHLVWGVDDGPQVPAVSQRLTRQAFESGTLAIIATPHCSARYSFDPGLVESRLNVLEQACDEPTLFRGCEVEINHETLAAIQRTPRRYTLNGGRYVLVELPHRFPHDRLLLVLNRLREVGLEAILAHPERYPLMWDRPKLAEGWVEAGGLLQLTADAFDGRYGRRARAMAADLVGAGLAHFVASDAHDPTRRPPGLQAAFRRVYELAGQAEAARLFTYNPLAVLHDEPL